MLSLYGSLTTSGYIGLRSIRFLSSARLNNGKGQYLDYNRRTPQRLHINNPPRLGAGNTDWRSGRAVGFRNNIAATQLRKNAKKTPKVFRSPGGAAGRVGSGRAGSGRVGSGRVGSRYLPFRGSKVDRSKWPPAMGIGAQNCARKCSGPCPVKTWRISPLASLPVLPSAALRAARRCAPLRQSDYERPPESTRAH